MNSKEPIIISGAGPIGSITGYYLATHGVHVILFDSEKFTPRDHRASTLHPTTLDMLAELNITEKVIPQGIISEIFQFRDRFEDRIVAEFDYRALDDLFQYPFALQVEQHKVVNTVHKLAENSPYFTLLRPWQVTNHTQDEDGVTVIAKNPAGELETFRGKYLIGADGGRSITRKNANINFPGFTWGEHFVIATTEYDFGTKQGGGHRYRNYVAHPTQWSALIKVAGDDMSGLWRILLPALQKDDSRFKQGSTEWVQHKFVECLPYEDRYNIIDINLYNVHQRVAETFHKGKVMLAGDAAHVNNPLGGMGMNGGIHDGLNLAKKFVDIDRKDGDPETLLPLYDRQRRFTATKYVQAQSIANKKLLEENDQNQRRKRLNVIKATSEDKIAAREYLKNSSLWTMLKDAEKVE